MAYTRRDVKNKNTAPRSYSGVHVTPITAPDAKCRTVRYVLSLGREGKIAPGTPKYIIRTLFSTTPIARMKSSQRCRIGLRDHYHLSSRGRVLPPRERKCSGKITPADFRSRSSRERAGDYALVDTLAGVFYQSFRAVSPGWCRKVVTANVDIIVIALSLRLLSSLSPSLTLLSSPPATQRLKTSALYIQYSVSVHLIVYEQ